VSRIKHVSCYAGGVSIGYGGTASSGGESPQRVAGDIRTFSVLSARRLRRWLLVHVPIAGHVMCGLDLTVPAYAVGHAEPCCGLPEWVSIRKRFDDALVRDGVGYVWRLEVQPRAGTSRADIRGIAQPHMHCICAVPKGYDLARLSGRWLQALGGRGLVRGARRRAAVVVDLPDGLGRMRYLCDHASKHKRVQIAVGWGRHWGVVGRRYWQRNGMLGETLDDRVAIWVQRLLRRITARRVPDYRRRVGSLAGIAWTALSDGRYDCRWVGGSACISDSPDSEAGGRQLARAMGAARGYVWALRRVEWRGMLPATVFTPSGVVVLAAAAKLSTEDHC